MEEEKIFTEDRIVCFADVLGFKQMIEKYDLDSSSNILFEFREAYQEAIDSVIRAGAGFNSKRIKFQMFSDNICISISYKNKKESFVESFAELSFLASFFQLSLMTRGFYIRGGIAKGSYYSDNNMIFSNALVKAYELESKKAIYPRIIVEQEIVDLLRNLKEEMEFCLITDWEGIVFVNPFLMPDSIMEIVNLINGKLRSNKEKPQVHDSKMNLQLSELINVIKNKVSITENHHIRSKYIWLLEFMKWKNNEGSGLKFNYFK